MSKSHFHAPRGASGKQGRPQAPYQLARPPEKSTVGALCRPCSWNSKKHFHRKAERLLLPRRTHTSHRHHTYILATSTRGPVLIACSTTTFSIIQCISSFKQPHMNCKLGQFQTVCSTDAAARFAETLHLDADQAAALTGTLLQRNMYKSWLESIRILYGSQKKRVHSRSTHGLCHAFAQADEMVEGTIRCDKTVAVTLLRKAKPAYTHRHADDVKCPKP